MLELDFYKNKIQGHKNFGKVYARVHKTKPIDIEGLADHIAEHGSVYTPDICLGVIRKMASCIIELCMKGQPVKLNNLCIFSPAVTSLPAADVDHFDLSIRPKGGDSGNISKVRIQTRTTGLSTNENVTRSATGLLGYTSLAQRIKNGELELSNTKGVYIVGENSNSGGSSGWGDEPVVNP